MVVWDEPKRLANLAKHGLDFAHFETEFDFDTAIAQAARASGTGRDRIKLIGLMRGRLVVAILSPLGSEAYGLVSLRLAGRTERQSYAER